MKSTRVRSAVDTLPRALLKVKGVVVTLANRENEETSSARDEGENWQLGVSGGGLYLREGRD